MKKLLLTLIIGLSIISCKKEDIQPTPPAPQECNCGIITDDDIIIDANGDYYYSLTIKNDCSGNLGTYYFSQDIWLNNYVGGYFCISNVSSWLSKPVGQITKVDVKDKELL